jgi:hypothetical protein
MAASYKSVAKYDCPSRPPMNDRALSKAAEWMHRHFAPHMMGSRVLSTANVIKELNMNTAPGYPFSLDYHTKRELFEQQPQVVDMFEDFWNDLVLEDRKHVPIWTCSQKVEIRTQEKVKDQKHRTFLVAPIELTVVANRLFLEENTRFYESHMHTWSYVGGTKYFGGWNRVHHHLGRHKNGFELDEANYDASVCATLLFIVMMFRFYMLCQNDRTPQNFIRIKEIYDFIINSVIILEDGTIIFKHTGNPSGSSNTIVDNTLVLFLLVCYAWIILAEEQYGDYNASISRKMRASENLVVDTRYDDQPFGSYNDMMENVSALLNGDDNTFTVSDKVVGWFNPTNIKRVWSGIGVITKTPCDTPRPAEDLTFLSSGFIKYKDMFLPSSDFDKVASSMMWGAESDDVRYHFIRANALRMDTWPTPACRSLLQGYIEYLLTKHKDDLLGDLVVKNAIISEKDYKSMYKSDDYLEKLYTGRESAYMPKDMKSAVALNNELHKLVSISDVC